MTAELMQNELALVCAAREGDKGALQTLLSHNWRWLKAVVYSVLKDARDLDDVMQDICLRAITRIPTLRDPECFRAWLATLARHEALKHGRSKSRRRHMDAFPAPVRMTGHEEEPLGALERRELRRQVLSAVAGLPEKYRDVFVLAQSGDLTYAQMAEVLDVPITTMQIRLVRARRMVRDCVLGERERQGA
jgi:RNA polymerase sigma-70 factor (ECF subfamily)